MTKTILVVDDVADIRNTIKTILELEKYKVVTAANGADCLAKLEHTKPHLILLDVIMPGLKTREILAEFKNRKLTVPVILMSGSSNQEMRKHAELPKDLAYPISDFIEKPFDNGDLIARIKKNIK